MLGNYLIIPPIRILNTPPTLIRYSEETFVILGAIVHISGGGGTYHVYAGIHIF